MKKIAAALLFSVFIASPVFAEDAKNNVGISYGFGQDGVVGIQGEFDISSSVKNAPVSIQLFWKNYSDSFTVGGVGTYQYSYNGYGVAALYDFGSVVKQNNKIKPYLGLGLYTLTNQLSGPAQPPNVSADSGGLYVVAGVRYAMTPKFAADLNFNNIGDLTVGANLNF